MLLLKEETRFTFFIPTPRAQPSPGHQLTPHLQRVCQGEGPGGVSRRLPPPQGGAEAGEGDERVHELDLQSRYGQPSTAKDGQEDGRSLTLASRRDLGYSRQHS